MVLGRGAPASVGRLYGLVLGLGLGMAAAGGAHAAELTYQPVNPAFGGNPLNGPQLLAVANAQNNYSAPVAPGSGQGDSLAQQFALALQSRLLSALADNITKVIFGDNPQQSGTIVFGDQTVSFDRGLDSVTLNITNTSTGQTTTISVPLLVSGP